MSVDAPEFTVDEVGDDVPELSWVDGRVVIEAGTDTSPS